MRLNELIKIGDRIKTYRKNLKLTQSQMADKLGLPRSTYAHYENNTREPNNDVLDKMAEVFGVSKFDLLYDLDKIKPKIEIMYKHATEVQMQELKNTEEYKKLYNKINNILDEFNYIADTDEGFNHINYEVITITDEYGKEIINIEKSIYVDFGRKMVDDIEKYKKMRVLYFLKELEDEQ